MAAITKDIKCHDGTAVRSQTSSLQTLPAKHAIVQLTVKRAGGLIDLSPVRSLPEKTSERILNCPDHVGRIQLQDQASHKTAKFVCRS